MKKIPLTQDRFAVVDIEDFEKVSQHRWCADVRLHVTYAASHIDRKNIMLHRWLLGVKKREIRVDHRDGDGLNNQRSNLRKTDASGNARNMVKHSKQFKGVSKKRNKFRARIMLPGKKEKYLGTFVTQQEAALAYDQAARKIFGEFARTNKCAI